MENRRRRCAAYRGPAQADYRARRNIVTLEGIIALKVQMRVCHRDDCALYRKALRAEEEGRWALPEHQFGLDITAHIGALRYHEHRDVPEIHTTLHERGIPFPRGASPIHWTAMTSCWPFASPTMSDCVR